MRLVRCDKCGQEYKVNSVHEWYSDEYVAISCKPGNIELLESEVVLCSKCSKDFRGWLGVEDGQV